MLYVYTKKEETTIINIESLFLLRYTDIKNRFMSNTNILYILKEIEGMTSFDGDVLNAKFGSVSLQNISMGAKACILAILYSDKYIVSSDEMGYNCIYALANVSKSTDIRIYSSAPYSDFIDGIDVYIDQYMCHSKEDVIDTMGALYD